MKVIEEGHIYQLESYEGMINQELKFISKKDGLIVHDGTTNEEVVKVLIDRITTLQNNLPCIENVLAVMYLEYVLECLDDRTQDRKERNVEGTGNV